MSKFPRCEKAGLEPFYVVTHDAWVAKAECVEAMLQRQDAERLQNEHAKIVADFEGADVFRAEDFGEWATADWGAKMAAHANRILAERSVVVYGHHGFNGNYWFASDGEKHSVPTHQALLVGVRPIVRDTAESLLREILDVLDRRFDSPSLNGVTERARKLLGGK